MFFADPFDPVSCRRVFGPIPSHRRDPHRLWHRRLARHLRLQAQKGHIHRASAAVQKAGSCGTGRLKWAMEKTWENPWSAPNQCQSHLSNLVNTCTDDTNVWKMV